MSLAGHLDSDPKDKRISWEHSSDVRPQNRLFAQAHRLLLKMPRQSQVCIPRRSGREAKEGKRSPKMEPKGRRIGKLLTG